MFIIPVTTIPPSHSITSPILGTKLLLIPYNKEHTPKYKANIYPY